MSIQALGNLDPCILTQRSPRDAPYRLKNIETGNLRLLLALLPAPQALPCLILARPALNSERSCPSTIQRLTLRAGGQRTPAMMTSMSCLLRHLRWPSGLLGLQSTLPGLPLQRSASETPGPLLRALVPRLLMAHLAKGERRQVSLDPIQLLTCCLLLAQSDSRLLRLLQRRRRAIQGKRTVKIA